MGRETIKLNGRRPGPPEHDIARGHKMAEKTLTQAEADARERMLAIAQAEATAKAELEAKGVG